MEMALSQQTGCASDVTNRIKQNKTDYRGGNSICNMVCSDKTGTFQCLRSAVSGKGTGEFMEDAGIR